MNSDAKKVARNIDDFAVRALAWCMLAAFSLLAALFVGVLTIVCTVDLFSHRLADMLLDSRVATAAVGGLAILCGYRISRAWKRKRASEKKRKDEIWPVLDIQIVEPPPPGRVERFFDRVNEWIERKFEWIDLFGDMREKWDELPSVVRLLAYALIGFVIGAASFWLFGVPSEFERVVESPAAIPFTMLAGWAVICVLVQGFALLLLLILLPLASPFFVWRALTSISAWLARNLPRSVILRYRWWQLRHMGRRRLRRAALAP
jgi:hypothetical protein